ncbi:alginate lyase family protein [Sungkyunkwania multivorans]|uniref:Alginate lyase family protein n=1 Tax=Sungkyunkwania multivorans TaxID=1173618 RepID=A0ABW3CVD1_9FLAO
MYKLKEIPSLFSQAGIFLVMRGSIKILVLCLLLTASCHKTPSNFELVSEIERERILEKASSYLDAKPITVTASFSERSAGGRHDYFSEGDYWWPNPEDPKGPYIRRDGRSNPDNFNDHRKALIRFCQISGALASAYLITEDKAYVQSLRPHLLAWFVDEETRMNPHLLYAQAISGKVTGRGIGIIDTVHLAEVAMAVEILADSEVASNSEIDAIKKWFKEYLQWLTSHQFGIDERDHGNNHSVCWTIQVAAFAALVDDTKTLDFCEDLYKNSLLPQQMDVDGSFPKELNRTKPYGYSLFNIDAMASVCQILSTEKENLFKYTTKEGKSLALGMQFIYPYIKDKDTWPYQKDVMYWEEWPVRQSSLLFAGMAFDNESYIKLWTSLNGDFQTAEIVRNMPVKHPLLWIER